MPLGVLGEEDGLLGAGLVPVGETEGEVVVPGLGLIAVGLFGFVVRAGEVDVVPFGEVGPADGTDGEGLVPVGELDGDVVVEEFGLIAEGLLGLVDPPGFEFGEVAPGVVPPVAGAPPR